MKTNRKVTVKDYMNYFDCSEATAKRYRVKDYKELKRKGVRTTYITASHFRTIYKESPFV